MRKYLVGRLDGLQREPGQRSLDRCLRRIECWCKQMRQVQVIYMGNLHNGLDREPQTDDTAERIGYDSM